MDRAEMLENLRGQMLEQYYIRSVMHFKTFF